MNIFKNFIPITAGIAIMIFASGLLLFTSAGTTTEIEKLSKADRYFHEKSYRLARDIYDELLPDIKQKKIKLHTEYNAAVCSFMLKDIDDTVVRISRIEKMRPGNIIRPKTMLLKAMVLSQKHRYDKRKEIVSLLDRAEEGFRDFSKTLTREPMIDLLKLRIQLVYENRWQKKDWFKKALHETKKLEKLLSNPGEKAEMLFKFADYLRNSTEKKQAFELYLKTLMRIFDNYPTTKYAPAALFTLGGAYEYDGKYKKAINYYKIVLQKYPKDKAFNKQAKTALARITSEQAGLVVPRIYKPGEKIELKLTTRNIRKLAFKLYAVDIARLLKKTKTIEYIDSYKISAGDKLVKSWEESLQDKGKHNVLNKNIILDLPKPGAFVLTAKSNDLSIRALVIVTDIAVVLKRSDEKSLIWVVDAITGEPISGAGLMIASGRESQKARGHYRKYIRYNKFKYISGARTNALGLYIHNKKRDLNQGNMTVLAKMGNRYALSSHWHNRYYGRSGGIYLYAQTDRPVYRPGHKVGFKVVLRELKKGKYINLANKKVEVLLYDSKRKKLKEIELKSNSFGSISREFKLPDDAALGQYYFLIRSAGESRYHYFRVEEYKKPEFTVSIKTSEKQYRLGKNITVNIESKYYFGEPVKEAEVKYKIFQEFYYPYYRFPGKHDWFHSGSGDDYRSRSRYKYGRQAYKRDLVKQGKGKTGDDGNLKVKFPAKAYATDKREERYYRFRVEAEVTDKSRRMIEGSGAVMVGDRAFKIYLKPARWLYSPGDDVNVSFTAQNLSGEPVQAKGDLIIEKAKYEKKKKDYKYTRVSRFTASTDSKGNGEIKFKIKKNGYYRISFNTADKYDKPVKSYCWVWISDKTFRGTFYKYRGLEIITDKDTYLPGEEAHVLINSELSTDSSLLFTVENVNLFSHRILKLDGNSRMITVPINERYSPNIWFSLLGIHDFKAFSTEKQIFIPPSGRFLNVEVTAGKEIFKPGEKSEFIVTTTNKRGNPVSAEIALGVVDSSIFYIARDRTEDIRKFFYRRIKSHYVKLSTSFDFRYRSLSSKMYDLGNFRRFGRGGAKYLMESEGMADSAPAPMRARMSKSVSKKKNGGKDKELVEAEVRKDFRDTAYWSPTVKTGRDGRRKITIKFPESLTTWRLTARAVTKDTLVGNITDDLITRKNLMVRLQSPRFLTERDEVTLSTNIHNYLSGKVDAKVEMKVEGLDLITKPSKWVKLDKGEDKRVDFRAIANAPGKAKLTTYGRTNLESDAMQIEIPVIVHGVEKRFTENGKVDRKKTFTFNIPSDRKPGSGELKINIAPSLAGVILDCLDYLVAYPYGCVEQTMSRFIPAVIPAQTLHKFGVKKKKLESKLPKVVKAGIARLYDFQHSDGGWGWWKGDSSSAYMTSYVYYGLSLALEAGYDIDKGRLGRAEEFLLQKIKHSRMDLNNSAFALFALSEKRGILDKVSKQLDSIFYKREKLKPYSRALLAMAFYKHGDTARARMLLRNLYDFARLNKKNGTVSWAENESRWWYWYNDSVETTAAALRAYIMINKESKLVPMAVKWLVDNRDGVRWKSTRDTAMTVLALTDYIKAKGELNPAYSVKVIVNGKTMKKWQITKKDVFDYGKTVTLTDKELPKGNTKVEIVKNGKGELYFSAALEYFTKEEDISGVTNGLSIKRSFFLVDKKDKSEKKHILTSGDTVASGDEIEVELNLHAVNEYEYLVIEDYKAAGTEPYALVSGYFWQGRVGMQREMRDEKVAFFINRLPQGKTTIRYRIRAESPGKFHALPTIGYAMYSPKIYALSDEFRLTIKDKEASPPGMKN